MGSSRPALKEESLTKSLAVKKFGTHAVVNQSTKQSIAKAAAKNAAKNAKNKKLPADQKDEQNKGKHTKLSVEEIHKIVIEHQDLGKRLAWSFLTSWRVRLPQDDVTSVVGAALCEAANRFDPSMGVSFKTFFFYHLRGMLIKEIARIIEDQKLLHFMPQAFNGDLPAQDAPLHSTWALPPVENNNPEKLLERRELQIACSNACNGLDPLEKEVLIRYYINDEPLIDIASELNYCRCHISRVKTRAIEKVAKVLKGRYGPEKKRVHIPDIPRVSAANRSRDYTGGRGRRKPGQSEGRFELPAKLARKLGH